MIITRPGGYEGRKETKMKAIIKNIASENINDDRVSFAQTIDFSELFDHIKVFTGVTCNFNQPEISAIRGNIYISFTSENIAEQTGPFSAIFKNCYFYSFNNGVNRNRETNELGYWVSVDIMYEHKDGGSNGMDVIHASYTERTGWVFRDAGN